MAMEWMPIINRNQCTGCGRCVAACPTQALSTVDGKAALTFPERCIYCSACEDICPTNAIELPFLVVFKKKDEDDD